MVVIVNSDYNECIFLFCLPSQTDCQPLSIWLLCSTPQAIVSSMLNLSKQCPEGGKLNLKPIHLSVPAPSLIHQNRLLFTCFTFRILLYNATMPTEHCSSVTDNCLFGMKAKGSMFPLPFFFQTKNFLLCWIHRRKHGTRLLDSCWAGLASQQKKYQITSKFSDLFPTLLFYSKCFYTG